MASVLAGKYRLDGVIGSGAFGTVYRAEHLDIGRAVAVKVLEIPPGMESRADSVRTRFLREAKILGKVDHPNAVQVFDYGEHNGHPFLVMELLKGRTLHDALRKDGALSEPMIYRVTQQMLAALARAHEMGLVHRDLKPANVMLVPDLVGEEQVKLLDFGIATAFRDDSLMDARKLAVTMVGTFVGTPQYAAPEQFAGDATAASDVYAMGLLMWEMLLGKPAVGSPVLALCAEAHMGQHVWELPLDCPVSPELRRVIERALDKRPEHRYSDASSMLSDLQFMTRASTAEFNEEPKTMPASAPNFNDQPGDMLAGKYRLGKTIGAGGFSRVLKATHVDMEREVAIKILDLEGAVGQASGTTAADLQARFGREAKMSSQLHHPNTITVFDFGVDEHGRWYIVMEFVDGTNLYAAVRRNGRFDAQRTAVIARDILRSLAEAHHLGFLHRDLKPGNIMLTKDFTGDEAVKVLDFGIATVVDVNQANPQFAPMKATRMGTFVGTPQYAAPEQFLGEQLTPSTDIYMLGLVIWEMLTGRGAVEADGFGDCLKAHLDPSPWRFPEELGIPHGLAQIVYGALDKDPTKRYLSATEMANDLDRWLGGAEDQFRPSPTTEERWEPAMKDYAAAARKAAADKAAAEESARQPAPDDGVEQLLGANRFGGDRLTFDPNLDNDFEPEFLKPPKPKPKPTGKGNRRGQRGGLSSIPKFKEAKLELEQIEPLRSEPRRDAQVRTIEPGRLDGSRSSNIDWSKAAAGVGVLIVLVIAWRAMDTPPPAQPTVVVDDITKVEPMHLEDFENSLREPEDTETSFSTEGIVQAVEVAGWSVRREGDSLSLANVHEQGYGLRRGSTKIEMRVVATKSRRIAQKMFDDTRPPIGAIVLGNKVVRVFPPRGKSHPDVDAVVRTLRDYRELVSEGAE